ncbi:hypothetical protein, partial [Pseudomonas aeruginosa]
EGLAHAATDLMRTDAAPFRVLVDGPPALPAEAPANGRRP